MTNSVQCEERVSERKTMSKNISVLSIEENGIISINQFGKRKQESPNDEPKAKKACFDKISISNTGYMSAKHSDHQASANASVDDSADTQAKDEIEDRSALELTNLKQSLFGTADIISPNECIKIIASCESYLGFSPKFQSSLSMPSSFFVPITQNNINSYTNDVVKAICESDITTLKEMMLATTINDNKLQCCNRFGESALHLACRRGLVDVVTFMIEEANVSIRCIDDVGRNPLHDACWNREPVWDIMDMLVKKDPILLFLADRRGFTPFQYARKEHWHLWRQFLFRRRECFRMHKHDLKTYLS